MTILVWAGTFVQANDAMRRVGRAPHTWRCVYNVHQLRGFQPGTVVVKCGTWWGRQDAPQMEAECFARGYLVVNLQEYPDGQSTQRTEGGRRYPQDHAAQAERPGHEYAADGGRVLDAAAHAPTQLTKAISFAEQQRAIYRRVYPKIADAWATDSILTDAEFWDELATHIEESGAIPGGRGLCKALTEARAAGVISAETQRRLSEQAKRNKPADACAGYWWPISGEGHSRADEQIGLRRRVEFCLFLAAQCRIQERDKTAGDNVQRYRP